MSMLTNLDDAIVFKQTYIELYRRNPLHNPFSAERAFYHALQVCRRRLLAEDE
jgi:hypothetical protein